MLHSRRTSPPSNAAAGDPGAQIGTWALVLAVLILAASIAAQEAPPPETVATFKVVANAANPTTELTAAKAARMFLKKIKRWDHGLRVLPVDMAPKSPIRVAFTRSVHGKSVEAVQSFWQRMIFGRGEVPPEEKSSEEEILEFVRANPGAIGYLGGDTALGDGVKELTISP